MKNKSSIYYQLAVKNTRLDKSLLKEIMRINRMTKLSQKQFREMYESKYTSPEVRALLLYSLYTGKPADLKSIAAKDKREDRLHLWITAHTISGENYFRIVTPGRGVDFKRYALNEAQKKLIKHWRPIRDTRGYLTNAIAADNVLGQRVSVVFNEYATLLGALGYMTRMYIRLNDPRGTYYFTSDEEPDNDELAFAETSLGIHAANTAIFIKHLEHMKSEMYKYTDIMGRAGIDTTKVEGWVRTILDNAKYLYSVNAQRSMRTFELDEDGVDPVELMYMNHQNIVNMWDEVQSLGTQLDNYDFKKVTNKNINTWEVIPRFVDYREDKLHTHYREIKRGVADYYRSLRDELKPGRKEKLPEFDKTKAF